MNNVHEYLTFKVTSENDINLNTLDLKICRKQYKMEFVIYSKEINTDTKINNMSKHPTKIKALFRYFIKRFISLILTQKKKLKSGPKYLL